MRILRKLSKIFLVICIAIIFTGCLYCDSNDDDLSKEQAVMNSQTFQLTKAEQTIICEADKRIDLSKIDKELYISESGNYELYGEMNGKIVINAEEGMVRLIFSGVNIASGNGPAILVNSASKLIIQLEEATDNILADTPKYAKYQECKGTIHSECDVTINGKGKLYINGYYKDGIFTKDVLKIIESKVFITSKGNGLKANDGIMLSNSEIDIQCEKNGIETEKKGNEGKGNIDIISSEISLVAGEYGISCSNSLLVKNGFVNIKSIIGKIKVAEKSYIQEGCFNE